MIAYMTDCARVPRCQVHCMASAEGGQALIVGGAESSVTYLSRSRLERRARTPAASPSVYALAVSAHALHDGVSLIYLFFLL